MKLYPFSTKTLNALASPPEAGAGRHYWLWDVAVGLRNAGLPLPKLDAYMLILLTERGWHDRVKDWTDIRAKLSDPASLKPRATYDTKTPDWPAANHDTRRARYDSSPLFDPNTPTSLTTQDVLAELFDPDTPLCIGWNTFTTTTEPLSTYLATAHRAEFIVANPMTATGGRRASVNATSRHKLRHLVIEFDTHDTREQQAAVLSSLSTSAHPLILAVWSGGKSIHGWYDVSSLTPYQRLVFFRHAVYLGADRSLWDRAKLVRMPGGIRSTGQRQPILYFKPKETPDDPA